MQAKIIKIKLQPAKFGGHFYYIFFSDMKGGSYRTCIYPKYRNFQRWHNVIDLFHKGCEIWLEGLRVKGKGLVDADSPFFYKRTVHPGKVA